MLKNGKRRTWAQHAVYAAVTRAYESFRGFIEVTGFGNLKNAVDKAEADWKLGKPIAKEFLELFADFKFDCMEMDKECCRDYEKVYKKALGL